MTEVSGQFLELVTEATMEAGHTDVTACPLGTLTMTVPAGEGPLIPHTDNALKLTHN